MKRFLTTLALSCAVLTASAQPAAPANPADATLYRALGEKPGLRGLMEDFYTRLLADARTGPFFRKANRQHVIEQLTEQLCQESGGPCVYEGAPMDAVHADLDIGKSHFNALVEVLQDSMDARGIPFRAQNALLARLAPMHRAIVTRD